MEIVLIQDIKTLGSIGEVKDVKRGYAVNFLIPQGFALPARPGFIKEAQLRLKKQAKQRDAAVGQMGDIIAKISGKTIIVTKKARKEGKLFGSVKKDDIIEALAPFAGAKIDEKYIVLDEPIKQVGEYEVAIQVDDEVKTTVKVVVEAEK